MSRFLERLGVPRRINAAGTLTRLGGARMAPEVLAAMVEAAGASVDIAQLQSAASERIAQATGAEAGLVTSGASAGLTLATAAVLAGWDVARMAALPDTRRMPNRMLMHRTQRNSYDHAIRLAGAQIVDFGHNDRGVGAGVRGIEPWEIESALDDEVVGLVFAVNAGNVDDLAVAIQTAHRHGRPVIVDAAAQLPPRENLRRFIGLGADAVVFSGGKALGGPQSSGILAGRRDLIGSALIQMMDMDVHPQTWMPASLIDTRALNGGIPHHGAGRGFKVGKEEIAGLLCALERFLALDESAQHAAWVARLRALASAWQGLTGVRCELVEGEIGRVPRLELTVLAGTAAEVSKRLQALAVPVHLGESELAANRLTVNPMTIAVEDDERLAQSVREVMAAAGSVDSRSQPR